MQVLFSINVEWEEVKHGAWHEYSCATCRYYMCHIHNTYMICHSLFPLWSKGGDEDQFGIFSPKDGFHLLGNNNVWGLFYFHYLL